MSGCLYMLYNSSDSKYVSFDLNRSYNYSSGIAFCFGDPFGQTEYRNGILCTRGMYKIVVFVKSSEIQERINVVITDNLIFSREFTFILNDRNVFEIFCSLSHPAIIYINMSIPHNSSASAVISKFGDIGPVTTNIMSNYNYYTVQPCIIQPQKWNIVYIHKQLYHLKKKNAHIRFEVLLSIESDTSGYIYCSYNNVMEKQYFEGNVHVNFLMNINCLNISNIMYITSSAPLSIVSGNVVIQDIEMNMNYAVGYLNTNYVIEDSSYLEGNISNTSSMFIDISEKKDSILFFSPNSMYKICIHGHIDIHMSTLIKFSIRGVKYGTCAHYTFQVIPSTTNVYEILYESGMDNTYYFHVADVQNKYSSSPVPYKSIPNSLQLFIASVPTASAYNINYGVGNNYVLYTIDKMIVNKTSYIKYKYKSGNMEKYNFAPIRMEIMLRVSGNNDTKVQIYYSNVQQTREISYHENYTLNFIFETLYDETANLIIETSHPVTVVSGYLLIQSQNYTYTCETGGYAQIQMANIKTTTDNNIEKIASVFYPLAIVSKNIACNYPDPFILTKKTNSILLTTGYYKICGTVSFEKTPNHIGLYNFFRIILSNSKNEYVYTFVINFEADKNGFEIFFHTPCNENYHIECEHHSMLQYINDSLLITFCSIPTTAALNLEYSIGSDYVFSKIYPTHIQNGGYSSSTNLILQRLLDSGVLYGKTVRLECMIKVCVIEGIEEYTYVDLYYCGKKCKSRIKNKNILIEKDKVCTCNFVDTVVYEQNVFLSLFAPMISNLTMELVEGYILFHI